MNFKRMLVVGGSGFIGQHVIDRAVSEGYNVTCLGLTAHNGINKLPGVNYVQANLEEAESIRNLANNKFEYIVNLSGYINHTLFNDGGRSVINTHFNGLLNLLEFIDRKTVKRFIQIGSSDEYGFADAPQREELRECPISPYSLSKVAATHFLQMLYRTEDFPATIIRLFLTYGPGQKNNRFLPQIILGCLNDNIFPVSAGDQLRDFCFIKDTVDAIFKVILIPESKGEVINIASGKPLSIRQLIEMVRKNIGKGTPKFGEIPYRSGENMRLYADIKKANDQLGWKPQVSIEDGLLQTILWIKESI